MTSTFVAERRACAARFVGPSPVVHVTPTVCGGSVSSPKPDRARGAARVVPGFAAVLVVRARAVGATAELCCAQTLTT